MPSALGDRGIRRHRWPATTGLALLFVMAFGTPAFARHNFSMLKVNPERGIPGGDVSVSGFSYPVNTKVSIRFNALDGPVLAALDPTPNQDISGTVRIPTETAPGRYVLYAVQADSSGKPNRIPGRAAFTVSGREGQAVAVASGLELEARSNALIKGGGVGVGQLVLVGLGAFAFVGCLGLFMARAVTSRKAEPTEKPA